MCSMAGGVSPNTRVAGTRQQESNKTAFNALPRAAGQGRKEANRRFRKRVIYGRGEQILSVQNASDEAPGAVFQEFRPDLPPSSILPACPDNSTQSHHELSRWRSGSFWLPRAPMGVALQRTFRIG